MTDQNRKKKLFNMDLHISVIADFVNLFGDRFEISEVCMSAHAWCMGKTTSIPNHINIFNWKDLNQKMIDDFYAEYGHILETFDGFICAHPNAFCMIFERYNKPIIMINSCRYDMPFCWSHNKEMLDEYHRCIKRLVDKKLLHVVSNNLFDKQYLYLGTGIQATHIPSLCLYTNMRYQPTRKEFLLYNEPQEVDLPHHPLIIYKSQEFSQGYKWTDLQAFQGIIYIPYEISTMSKFEHFSASIPMFFPSYDFLLKHTEIQISAIDAYWGKSFATYKRESLSLLPRKTYLQYNDWINVFSKSSNNIFIYESYEHLYELLEKNQGKFIPEDRGEYIKDIISKWNFVLDNI